MSTADPQPDSQGDRAFGNYTLRRLIGKGGMGNVYEAYDTERRRTVALKVLAEQYSHDEQFRARFQRESHAAAILQEPHVIPIHDWGEIDGQLYIDMRLVKGKTLHDLIKAGPLEPARAVAIVAQVAAALDAAHAEGLVHRDVKPQNIIVTEADFAYLLDFGIAEARDDTHLTMAGQRIGSLHYMAPERFSDRDTTAATDVYSLACVLYESLVGKPPFPSTKIEQAMAAHLSAHPPRPSVTGAHIPPALDNIIARGMAKEPDDRYGSAGALGRAAERALHADQTSPPQADTMLAAHYVAPAVTPAAPAPPSAPAPVPPGFTDPGTYPGGLPGRSGSAALPIAVVVAAAVLIAAVGLLAGLLINRQSAPTATSTTTLIHPTTSIHTVTETTEYRVEPSETPTPRTTPSRSPEPLQRLQQLATTDHPYVAAQLADMWVPQLSSKRPGTVDQGMVWDNATTLAEHLQLRRAYPGVRLVWSGDWSTFSAPDYWVTVVGITYADSAGALRWCRTQGFDRDHCIAKVISATRPIEGSTAYN